MAGLPVVAQSEVKDSWLADLHCIGGTLKKLGGSGASEALAGGKRRSVFSRKGSWKSRLFWIEIAPEPSEGENYTLRYGASKTQEKGRFQFFTFFLVRSNKNAKNRKWRPRGVSVFIGPLVLVNNIL